MISESEVKPSLKKNFSLLRNELVETDRMDDIPAGSVVQVIKVVEAPEKSLPEHHSNSSSSTAMYALNLCFVGRRYATISKHNPY